MEFFKKNIYISSDNMASASTSGQSEHPGSSQIGDSMALEEASSTKLLFGYSDEINGIL